MQSFRTQIISGKAVLRIRSPVIAPDAKKDQLPKMREGNIARWDGHMVQA